MYAELLPQAQTPYGIVGNTKADFDRTRVGDSKGRSPWCCKIP